ncbi:hypothetical protein C443_17903 [Haloarcula argentinensis DSM 12282]|nr:hypothetical protein C443_17903 [Haloarcula argentinensis DSM 12282]
MSSRKKQLFALFVIFFTSACIMFIFGILNREYGVEVGFGLCIAIIFICGYIDLFTDISVPIPGHQ